MFFKFYESELYVFWTSSSNIFSLKLAWESRSVFVKWHVYLWSYWWSFILICVICDIVDKGFAFYNSKQWVCTVNIYIFFLDNINLSTSPCYGERRTFHKSLKLLTCEMSKIFVNVHSTIFVVKILSCSKSLTVTCKYVDFHHFFYIF